jgi:hypothetical protein
MIFIIVFILSTFIFFIALNGGAIAKLEMNSKLVRDFLIYAIVVFLGYGFERYF